MQKLLTIFAAGVVLGSGVVSLAWMLAPPVEQVPEVLKEAHLQQSEAEIKRLTAEVEQLREDRLLFERYESESPAPAREQAIDRAPVSQGENTDLYTATGVTETDHMTVVADQAFRDQLFAEADDIYRQLENNPVESEGRRYLKQARDTYIRAGSPNQAIKMQEELLQLYREPDPYHQLAELASLKNTVGDLDEAISVLNNAINTTPRTINKLNGMRRVARYKEKRFGSNEALTAWRELDQYASSVGEEKSKPARKARMKIEQLEQSLGMRP